MPRTKGSKNKPKTVTADFATQIAEKQSAKEALTAEIASITANIDRELSLQISCLQPFYPDIRIVHQIKNSLAPTAEDIRFSISADKGFQWLEFTEKKSRM